MNDIGFYKADSRILSVEDANVIVLHHHLMRKENITRLAKDNELPKGQFKLSLQECAKWLDMTVTRASRVLKKIEDLGVITLVKKGTSKTNLTVYQYNTYIDGAEETNPEPKKQDKPKQEPKEKLPEVVEPEEMFEYDFLEADVLPKIDLITSFGICVDVQNANQLDIIKCMSAEQIEKCASLTQANAKADPLKYFFTTFNNNFRNGANTFVDYWGNEWKKEEADFEGAEDIVEDVVEVLGDADDVEEVVEQEEQYDINNVYLQKVQDFREGKDVSLMVLKISYKSLSESGMDIDLSDVKEYIENKEQDNKQII